MLLGTGSHPTDLLHLLYGPAALVTLAVGVWLSRRAAYAAAPVAGRRDAWIAVTAIVLTGVVVRLFMTG